LKMELIEGSETSENYNRTPGKYPKEYIQYSKHGKSLKSRIDYLLTSCSMSTQNRAQGVGIQPPLLHDHKNLLHVPIT